ncbi:hypothetical protein PLICRDRAFT_702425 [Plicaturopsis crispa FD-325 SS-3]|uniref:CMP/dCMP-type deaminase domain-containing protein n=1 Tax=Plicaturopsis crispa FD-325 SS-3 TaxID=944288 RepID=A0A0C9SKE9_PLICR|nr:hypothetical protein PLICRDRAFT_702425 [Plicaturopsis crispa FD-325 SS-3]
MNKTQYYLSECVEAASKSSMVFTLGSIMVKGGKIISTGYNHQRPGYNGTELQSHGHRKPVSMHAEMHAIFNVTGMSPSFKKQKGRRSPKGVPASESSVFQGPPPRTKRSKTKKRRACRHCASPPSSSGECGESAGGSTKESADKRWDARRRDPRVNGADLYVVRVTKKGMGSCKPCWRCLEWARWAGVKRIFHWNNEEGVFEVVKVNNAESTAYETHADVRLYAGLGW